MSRRIQARGGRGARGVRRAWRSTYRVLFHVLVALVMFTSLFPFLWMLSTSFKTLNEALTWPPTVFPKAPNLLAYQDILTKTGIFHYLANTVIYAGAGASLAILFSSLAGFAFAKYRFAGRRVLFALVLATMMIPFQITLIPVFLILKTLGWINTFMGLIVPGLGDAFGIFLIRQFAFGVPDELLDSARIDGAGEVRIFSTIFLPLCAPAVGTLLVLSFMNRWNDLFWPLIVTTGDKLRTIQLGLIAMQMSLWETIWPQLTASMVLVLIPILLLYIFLQRYFTQGIVLTGLKG